MAEHQQTLTKDDVTIEKLKKAFPGNPDRVLEQLEGFLKSDLDEENQPTGTFTKEEKDFKVFPRTTEETWDELEEDEKGGVYEYVETLSEQTPDITFSQQPKVERVYDPILKTYMKKTGRKRPSAVFFLDILRGSVDKLWKPNTLKRKLPKTKYEYLFNEGNVKLKVPLNQTVKNQVIYHLQKHVLNYHSEETVGTVDETNFEFEAYLPKKDPVWKSIPHAYGEKDFPHDEATVEYFIEKIGLTTLEQTDSGTLYRNFDDFGGLEVEFQKINPDRPWRKDNAMIIKKKPDDPHWHIKIRSAAIHHVTVTDHLLFVHLTYSNYLAQAVATLSEEDHLRELLIPHVIGSIEKNSDAYWNLYMQYGLVEGAAGKSAKEVLKQMKKVRKAWINSSVKTYPEWKQNNKKFLDTKYVQRGDHVYNCIKDYVSEYFNSKKIDYRNYGSFWEVMKEMIGNPKLCYCNLETWIVECIWRVTYFHYQVGSVLPYLFDSSIIRWAHGEHPTYGVWWSLVIAFSTSERQYQLINPKYCTSLAWHNFVKKLTEEYPRDPTDKIVEAGIPDWIWELELSTAR